MKVLIVGSGGREHAIATSVAKSSRVDKIYCAPGNAGIGQIAECVPIGAMEFDKLVAFAKENEIELKEGVYVQLTGPQFESPAEIRFLRTAGADAVGMSTAIEAIAATHANIKVCGISCITNMACGILPQPLTAEEVSETADRVAPDFKKLILKTIEKIGELNG